MKKFLNDGEDGPMPTNFTSQYIKPQNNKGVGEVDEKEKMKKKMKMDPKKKKKVMAARGIVANKLKNMMMER